MKNLELRVAEKGDVEFALRSVQGAQGRLARAGVSQWQNGYPNRERLEEDVRLGIGRVLMADGQRVAYGVVTYDGERAYDGLRGGEWLTSGAAYATIHRLCVAEDVVGRGYGRAFMECAEREAATRVASLRVDTHPDNLVMQQLISSLGYRYCGVVEYESPRLAYELCLQAKCGEEF
ncbi:MAG: hypothetical protein IKY63_00565 [Tidjanibacter sp.]|nr:hypothetical protein [Tidjanibacter sp.]